MRKFLNYNEWRFFLETDYFAEKEVDTPSGWDEMQPEFERDKKYNAIFRSFTNPVKWVGSGKDFIKKSIITHGYNQEIRVRIERLNNTASPMVYEDWYSGILDTYDLKFTDYADCGLIDNSTVDKIVKNEDTVYDINYESLKSKVEIDGLALFEQSKCIANAVSSYSGENTMIFGVAVQEEERSILLDSVIETLPVVVTSTSVFHSNFNFYSRIANNQVTVDMLVNINTFFEFIPPLGASLIPTSLKGKVAFYIYKQGDAAGSPITTLYSKIINNTTASVVPVATSKVTTPGQLSSIDETLTFTLGLKERLIFVIKTYDTESKWVGGLTGSVATNISISTTYNTVQFDYTAQDNKTISYGVLLGGAINLMLDKILGAGTYTFYQNNVSYANEDSDTLHLLISGRALKDEEDRVISTSLSDLLKFAYVHCRKTLISYFSAGNLILKMESIENLYADNEICDIGEVSDMIVEISKDFIYSKVKTGCGKFDYGKLNSIYEFNNNVDYEFKGEGSTLDLTTKIRTDIHGIELVRFKYGKELSKDEKEDNDLFAIAVKLATGKYVVSRDNEVMATGGYPNMSYAYNCLYSALFVIPKFMPEIALFKKVNKNATFELTFAEKNKDLSRGIYTIEQPIGIIDTAQCLFTPYLIRVNNKGTSDLFEIMKTVDGYGYVSFEYKGNNFKGFALSLKDNTKGEPQEWQLLCENSNDLNELL